MCCPTTSKSLEGHFESQQEKVGGCRNHQKMSTEECYLTKKHILTRMHTVAYTCEALHLSDFFMGPKCSV